MDEFEFPCPKCGEPLISDGETGGTEAVCPYCDKLIIMASEPPLAEKSHLPARRHDGAPMPTGESNAEELNQPLPNSTPGATPTHLPSGRKRQAREDLGRLAAMASGPQIDPTKSSSTGGLNSFHCPGCARLIWIRPKDAGRVVQCSGCSLEVICPAPGQGPSLLHTPKSDSHHPHTTIPTSRQDNHIPAEHIPKTPDRTHKRSTLPSGPNRPGRTLSDPASDSPRPSPKEKVRPIPRQRDVEISPSGLKRYRAASRERKIQKAIAPHEELKTSTTPQESGGILPPSRRQGSTLPSGDNVQQPLADTSPVAPGVHRLNPERMPMMDAREDLNQESGEPIDPWGANTAQTSRGTRRLLILALALGLPALAAAGFFALRNQESTPPNITNEEVEDNSVGEYEASKALLDQFLDASTLEQRLLLVRHPDESRQRMEIHEQQDHPPLPSVVDLEWPESGWIEDKKFTWIDVRFNDGNPRTAVFEITPDGPKLDWESFVFYENPLMSEFVSSQPEKPGIYRVTCTIDKYYNRLYDDEEKFFCFYLKGPDGVSSCWGYTDISSDIGWAMSQLFNQKRQLGTSPSETSETTSPSIKVMLKLHFEKDQDGKSNSQAWIDEIVSDSWIIP